MATAATAQNPISLAELRRRVVSRLGDGGELLTATANGTTSTFIDLLDISYASETRDGQWVYFISGTAGNVGKTARVLSTDPSTNKITFTPAVTSNTAVGDVIETTNFRGIGFRPDQVNNAINNAINDAFPFGTIKISADVTGYLVTAPGTIVVPDNLYYVSSVAFLDTEGYEHPVLRATATNYYGWNANATTGEISITGGPGWLANGMTIRLTGYGRQDVLSADTDTCLLRAESIVDRACYHLALSKISTDPSYGQMVNVFKNDLQRSWSRLRTPFDPSLTLVRNL